MAISSFKDVLAPFLPLPHAERAAHAVSAGWQGFAHMRACPGCSHTCYKPLATGRTWSSGWSSPGPRAVVLQRAGRCRRHTRSYLWQSSSTAAQRTRCPPDAATDRNALAGNHLQRKEKERDSFKLFDWIVHWIFCFSFCISATCISQCRSNSFQKIVALNQPKQRHCH